MEGLAVGRTVHFVLPEYRGYFDPGEHRSAEVVRVWEHGYVNLAVALDGSNDTSSGELHRWETSIGYDPEGAPGTWHWPERA